LKTLIKKYYRKYKRLRAKALTSSEAPRFGAYNRVYHLHLRKSGGTSINSAFWNLGGLNLKKVGRAPILVSKSWVFVRNHLSLIEEGNYHFGNSHMPLWKLKLPPHTFTFCMLRDPYSRLVSLYKYYYWIAHSDPKEVIKNEPYYYSLKEKLPNLGSSFSEFLDHLPAHHLQHQLYMFSETMDKTEALDSVRQLNRVYFQSSFSAAIEDLSSTLGVPLDVKRERSFKQSELVITEEEKQKAMTLLKEEYEFFNQMVAQYATSTKI
jgi:Sulfotransferase family